MRIQDKNQIKQTLLSMSDIIRSYHISKIGLFGSYVHNSQNEKSDIDLLVDFSEPVDLFAYVNLADRLSQRMEIRVDLVTVKGLKPSLRNKILSEVEWIEGI